MQHCTRRVGFYGFSEELWDQAGGFMSFSAGPPVSFVIILFRSGLYRTNFGSNQNHKAMKTPSTKNIRTFIVVMMLLTFCPVGLFAQQIIRFKSGYEYRVIIVRQTADTVKYQLLTSPDITIATPMDQVESITQVANLKPVHDKAYWDKRLTKYSRFCIAGGVVFAGGVVLTAVTVSQKKDIEDAEEFQERWGMFLLSTAAIVTGSVLLITGGINVGIAKKELRKIKLELEANPAISGVTVRVRF
jgi:hypothetical protein